LVLVSKISPQARGSYESIFYKAKIKPTDINIVWKRMVKKPGVPSCIGLADFFTMPWNF
jgi:ethanolamine utilization protein EutQ (cupin superfamily)